MSAATHRIGYIDGLRAVAVLLVVAHHMGSHYPHLLTVPILGAILRHGNHGVDLFFILSGFCLSYPVLRRLKETGGYSFDVARFAAHRIVRIVPPYWIAIALFAALAAILAALHQPAPSDMAGRFTVWDVVKQALFIDVHVRYLNGSFWTLPVEFRWYFYMPIALLLWVKRRTWFWWIASVALALSFIDLRLSRDFDYIPAFLLGIVAAHLALHGTRKNLWWYLAFPILLATAAFVTPTEGMPTDFISPFWYLSAFAFVVCAGCSAWLRRALTVKWLTATGLASYSIYLVHEPLVGLLGDRGYNPLVTFSLPIAAGFAFWWIAERPFVAGHLRDTMVHSIESFLRPRPPQPSSANQMALPIKRS